MSVSKRVINQDTQFFVITANLIIDVLIFFAQTHFLLEIENKNIFQRERERERRIGYLTFFYYSSLIFRYLLHV